MSAGNTPIIGIILDWEEKGSYSDFPHYALRKHYFDVIAKLGGIPFGISYDLEITDRLLDSIDGLIIPGGEYAFPDSWYYENNEGSTFKESPRFSFESKLLEKALEKNMPVLGICAGMQLMAGIYGGKLISDYEKFIQSPCPHRGIKKDELAHEVAVSSSLLGIDKKTFGVNSHHRECIISLPEQSPINISGAAEDEVIEMIEIRDKNFALGVQWHPEFMLSKIDRTIFEAFLLASSKI